LIQDRPEERHRGGVLEARQIRVPFFKSLSFTGISRRLLASLSAEEHYIADRPAGKFSFWASAFDA